MRRCHFLLLAFLPILGRMSAAPSPDDPRRSFDLPAGPAAVTLRLFAAQSGEQVVYFTDQVAGVSTRQVKGVLSPLAALQHMFAGTAVRPIEDRPSGALSLAAPPQRRAKAGPAGPTGPAPPTDSGASADVDRLPSFEVDEPGPDRYRAADVVSIDRIRGSAADLPLSVGVVTRRLLDDLSADSLYQAARFLPGVSNGRGSGAAGIMDRQDFRGFESFTKTIDDFSSQLIPSNSGFVAVFDPEFVERAEIVMGPDVILAPTGSPGGSMNILTKSPRFAAETEARISYGNLGGPKLAVDSTGPFDSGRWAYRVIADYQDGPSYLPGGFRDFDLSVQATRRLSDSAQVTVKYFGTQWELTGAASNLNDNGWEVTDPGSIGGATIAATPPRSSGFTYDGWNGDAPWSHTFDRVNIVSAELTAPVGNRLRLRLGAEVLFDNNLGDNGYPAAAPQEIFSPATGQVVRLIPIDPSALAEVARLNHALSEEGQVQNDLAGSFNCGPVTLEPVAGWTWQWGTTATRTSQAALPDADLARPYAPPQAAAGDYQLSSSADAAAWQGQAYGLIRADFLSGRLLATLGLSRSWIHSTTGSWTAAAGSAPFALNGGRNSYLAGLLVRPADWLSVYYSRSTNAALTNASNRPLWQQGSQGEFGAKAEFFGQRLAVTAAQFQIQQRNVVTPNPLYNINPALYPESTLSDQTNRGEEFGATGGVTERLSVILSATWMRFRDPFGRRVRNVPDHFASALLHYRLGENAANGPGIYGGMVEVGQTAGEDAPNQLTSLGVPEQVGYYVPGWIDVSCGGGCSLGPYRLRISVDNALNAHFAWQPASRLSISPYPGTSVRVTTERKF